MRIPPSCHDGCNSRSPGAIWITKPFQGNASEVDRFRGNIEPVHSCSVRDDHLDHTDIDAKRHRTGPFRGALAIILDQHRAIDMAYPLFAEVVFQSGQGRGFPSARWFPNRAHVVYMQVDEIAKRCKAGGGRLVRCQVLIDTRLRLTGPFVGVA